jgi:release factor glutamine methyltransferase
LSEGALHVAKKNARDNSTEIHFLHLDFLDEAQQKTLPQFDIIVSNPPYIPLSDKHSMHANVTAFEPHTALFVEDNDALIFYKAIAGFAKTHLNENGRVFVEMHEKQASDVKKLFSFMGFDTVEIRKDMQQKDRMLKATMLL